MKSNSKYIALAYGITFFVIEFLSRIILPQPVFSPRTFQHSDGLRTNKNYGTSVHSYFKRKKIKYNFGGLYSRINPKNQISKEDIKEASKTCRFLILGDSYVFGWLVDYKDTFVYHLQKRINSKSSKKIYFLNSARGGAGFDFYTAFTEKFKKEILKYDGLILFSNSDDSQRILRNNIYKVNEKNEVIRANNKTSSNNLRQLINKYRILNFSYSFLLENSNIMRIVHNLYINGATKKEFNLTKDSITYKAPGVKYKNKKLIKDQKPSIKEINFLKSLIQRFSENTSKIPTTIIYIGSSKIDQLSGLNKFFYSSDGKKVLSDNNLDFDFSLLNKAPTYNPDKDLILGDWHPNEVGHYKIANHLIDSNHLFGLKRFVDRNCSVE